MKLNWRNTMDVTVWILPFFQCDSIPWKHKTKIRIEITQLKTSWKEFVIFLNKWNWSRNRNWKERCTSWNKNENFNTLQAIPNMSDCITVLQTCILFHPAFFFWFTLHNSSIRLHLLHSVCYVSAAYDLLKRLWTIIVAITNKQFCFYNIEKRSRIGCE